MKPTSKFANQHERRFLAKPDDQPSRKPRERPASKPAKARMTEVTVKLPGDLLAKLDRLCKRESTGLVKAGRSTVMRWLLEREPE